MKQPDMFVEAEDRRIFAAMPSLKAVADRLPSKPWLTPSDIATALDMVANVVYRWLDSGYFVAVDIGGGKNGKSRWRIQRSSFLRFIASRMK